jgi:hypothetical protein
MCWRKNGTHMKKIEKHLWTMNFMNTSWLTREFVPASFMDDTLRSPRRSSFKKWRNCLTPEKTKRLTTRNPKKNRNTWLFP